MVISVIITLLLLGGIAGCIAYVVLDYRKRKKAGGRKRIAKKAVIPISVAALLFALLVFIPAGFQSVQSGEVAVVKVWGEATAVKDPGLHFRNIMSTEYVTYSLRTQQMNINNEVYTKDAQPLSIQMTLHYSIKLSKVLDINRTYGLMSDLNDRIQNVAIEKAKVVLSAKTAMELIETRSVLSPNLAAEIKTIEEQYFINIENVVIVDMAFSPAFEQAVEQKMIAEQEKLKAQYDKEKAIVKAEEELEVARLQAEQAIERAKGQAEAQVETAKGEARALKQKTIEIARMLGFIIKEIKDEDGIVIDYEVDFENSDPGLDGSLISDYLKYIAYLEAWDGKLPQVIMGEDGSIIFPTP